MERSVDELEISWSYRTLLGPLSILPKQIVVTQFKSNTRINVLSQQLWHGKNVLVLMFTLDLPSMDKHFEGIPLEP